jgi:hypothetical protein
MIMNGGVEGGSCGILYGSILTLAWWTENTVVNIRKADFLVEFKLLIS